MGHMRSSKDNLLKRVKRIAGQVQAIERALDSVSMAINFDPLLANRIDPLAHR